MILTVIGARPQFVKAAVVSRALMKMGIEETIIHTGQHYDQKMSQVFWDELGIPEYSYNLKAGSASHGLQTARMIEKLEAHILENGKRYSGLLLYGDTNSTLAGSIVASKIEGLKIIHVEAGLRSFNRAMPEEVNRIVTDHLSDLLFCSSGGGVSQLKKEGITAPMYEVGDVMYDALLTFSPIAEKKIRLSDIIPFPESPFVLATIHRPSNTDRLENLTSIFKAIGQMNLPVIWPVHPRNQNKLKSLELPANLFTVPPVSYLEMLQLLSACEKVITDSGGLQKEAYWKKKQCITLRKETEWTETLRNGWNTVTGSDEYCILKAFHSPLDERSWTQLYGDGKASEKIANIIAEHII